jgi:2-polyprenyl-3-methyl-5-hydroxy-6-metoxy-1,4-benzoquinol methylase
MTPPHNTCQVCHGSRLHKLLAIENYPVVRCTDCGYAAIHPQPSDDVLAQIYGAHYELLKESDHRDELKRATAEHYLKLIAAYRAGSDHGALLEVGCGTGEFLAAASQMGYTVFGAEISESACELARKKIGSAARVITGDIDSVQGRYDVIALNDVIEHVRDPRAALKKIHDLLNARGAVFMATPNLDSWSARLLGNRWMEFKLEHLHYFRPKTLALLLAECGFQNIRFKPGVKVLSLEYIMAHFKKYPVKGLGWIPWLPVPAFLRGIPIRIVASGMIVMASKPE